MRRERGKSKNHWEKERKKRVRWKRRKKLLGYIAAHIAKAIIVGNDVDKAGLFIRSRNTFTSPFCEK